MSRPRAFRVDECHQSTYYHLVKQEAHMTYEQRQRSCGVITITDQLLCDYDGKVPHWAAKAAGGHVYEQTFHYTKFEMPDGSRIAVYRVPFDGSVVR
jgi:hypothetical protein